MNGTQQGSSLDFPATESWTTWNSVSRTIILSAGTNTIRLQATASGGLANVDYIQVTAVGAAAASCTQGARMTGSASIALKQQLHYSKSCYELIVNYIG